MVIINKNMFDIFKEKNKEKIELPAEDIFKRGEEALEDILAPSAIENRPNYIRLGDLYSKTYFIFSYTRYLEFGWLSPMISSSFLYDISIFFHPIDVSSALKQLRKKAAQLEVQIRENEEKGMVRDPVLEIAYQNVERLRDSLQSAEEKLFRVGAYITIWAPSLEDLDQVEKKFLLLLESRMIYAKPAIFQHLEGAKSTFPLGEDELEVYNILDTFPASTLFPFTSADLKPGIFFKGKEEEAILYGINLNDQSPVIIDRFSFENYNMLILAKSGSGKSYFAKLEILRSLMVGIDFIIIDPENEYKTLTQKVGGSYFPISIASEYHINPFDLPLEKDETTEELIKSNILNLLALLRILIKDITPEEEALLDKALNETYLSRDIDANTEITPETEFPTLSDLQEILKNMDKGRRLANELYRFTQGTFANFLDQPTNINIYNRLVTFSLRDLEEELRPIAMFLVLNFIWKAVRSNPKKRLVLVDEAWYMLAHKGSLKFFAGLAKRARKYLLGLTIINQNLEDLVSTDEGVAILSNSSLQMLMRQSPADVKLIKEKFHLSEAAAYYLPKLERGKGIFVVGNRQALVEVVSSFIENEIASSSTPVKEE